MIDVSVVIPTFRRSALLMEAIDSVLRQADVSVEIIVVDDCHDCSAREAVASVGDARVHYFPNETPSGGQPALVRNLGARKATGRYIHFLDDDDLVADHYYRDAVREFNAHPESGVVFGQIRPFAGRDSTSLAHEQEFFATAAKRARLLSSFSSRRLMTAALLFLSTQLVNSACIIRREHVQTLGGYDDKVLLNEDVDFYCRAIRAFGCRFLDQVVVHYRILPDSLMHGRTGNEKLIQSYRRMYERYRETHGAFELLALKIVARTVMRIV